MLLQTSAFNIENFSYIITLIGLFLIYFVLWVNFSYLWHVLSENNFYPKFLFVGLKQFWKMIKNILSEDKKTQNQIIVRKLWILITIRWLLLIVMLFILFLNLFNVSTLGFNIFLVFYLIIIFIHVLYELESKNTFPGFGEVYYGNSFAIYEFLSFICVFLWIIINQDWIFTNFRINPWNTEVSLRSFQTICEMILLFSVARSSNYLGYKNVSNYQISLPKVSPIPQKVKYSISLSQSFFQALILFLLAMVTTHQTYLYIFGFDIEIWLYSFTFFILLSFYSFLTLFFSTASYRMKQKSFSNFLPILVYFISLIAIILYFLTIIR